MEKQTLGQKISELRKAKNMTQLELANKLNITDKADVFNLHIFGEFGTKCD
jgi:transcriptional regulator with XRE-family HTH domain